MRLQTIFLSLLFSAFSGHFHPAKAACVDLWMRALQSFGAVGIKTNEFKLNDQFVVCFRLEKDAYVSLWDAPPKGDAQRLYPNALTHRNNAQVRADKLGSGREHCFGNSGTFPLYFPAEQGTGEGKISIVVTDSLEDQPPLDAYSIPGRSMDMRRMERALRSYGISASCNSKMQEYFTYTISK